MYYLNISYLLSNIDSEHFLTVKENIAYMFTDTNPIVLKKLIACSGNILVALIRDAKNKIGSFAQFDDCVLFMTDLVNKILTLFSSKNEGYF